MAVAFGKARHDVAGVNWDLFPWWRRLEQARRWYASHPAAVPLPDEEHGLRTDGMVKHWASMLGYVLAMAVMLFLYAEALLTRAIPLHAWSFFMFPAGGVIAVSLLVCSWRKFPLWWNVANLAWLTGAVYLWVSSPDTGMASSVASILLAGAAGITGMLCGKWGNYVAVARSMPRVQVPVTLAAGISGPSGPFEYGRPRDAYTAGLLRSLSGMPGAMVFHNLRLPGRPNSPVAHAVLRGDRVILIDAEHWPQGTYEWSSSGNIVRRRKGLSWSRPTRFPEALDYYSSALPGHLRLYAVVLAHGKGVLVNPEKSVYNNITMAGPQAGMEFIGGLLEGSQGVTKDSSFDFLKKSIVGTPQKARP